MKTLVLVPQMVEAAPLVDSVARLGHTIDSMMVGSQTGWFAPDLSMAFVLSGHGKAQTAVQAQYAIDRVEGVSRVLCVGGAGGLSSEVAPLDVVVGIETVEHDYKLRFVPKPAPRHLPDPGCVEIMRSLAESGAGDWLRFGVIASGDEDIVDAGRAREIAAETGALCVAWEGAGAARAAAFNGLPFLELRLVTDVADQNAATDYHVAVKAGAPRLASALVGFGQPANAAAGPATAPEGSALPPGSRAP